MVVEKCKGFIKEFKEFAIQGNAIDLAIGVIIGGAFGTVVNSLAKDVIMPPIGLLLGKTDFANKFFVLKEGAAAGPYTTLAAATEAGAVTLNWGTFINVVITFLILMFVVFLMVKAINKVRKPVVAEVTTKACPFCKTEIALAATRCPACTSEQPAG